MERLINIELEGVFDAIMTFDKKSYVLLDTKGNMKIRGQTLKGRSLEPFCRDFLKECIEKLFKIYPDNNIRDIYEHYLFLINERLLTAEQIASTRTLNESLESYLNSVAQNPNKNRSAVYELALKDNRKYEKGDMLSFYVKEPPMETVMVRNKQVTRPMKLKAFEAAQPIKLYNYDYDIQHYTKRLNEVAKRLLPVLREEGFIANFPEIKLTKKDRDKLNKIEDTEEDD